ncbi:MAG: DUF3048 domain-containing protein [Anaerolineales bacterium]|nr:DUF3048 domain-containing protein [Anaerolineales bacterium]
MKKFLFFLGILTLSLACRQTAFLPEADSTPTASLPTLSSDFDAPASATPFVPDAPAATATPTQTPAPAYPAEGYGPSNFPSDINPLTGLQVADPQLLERRPIVIKVSNLPRIVRPQAGLSFADIVYEYYTEEGTTRFAAVFYGQDAGKVGSIRSGRFFDAHLIPMYKSLFVFGGADQRILSRLYATGYRSYMIFEWMAKCPAMCREAPGGYDMLFGNTQELSAYATRVGLDNTRQNLDGMFFQQQMPDSWLPGSGQRLYTRYSAVIYNRWDYDPASGKYHRFSETENDLGDKNEAYGPLTDALTGQQITADTIVVILTPHEYYLLTPEIVDIKLGASGTAYVFRDGQTYLVNWLHTAKDAVLTLSYPDGSPFPFKPGTTWFEVMGSTSLIEQLEDGWRFRQRFP